jgi:ketosteroid isomerase-like protein
MSEEHVKVVRRTMELAEEGHRRGNFGATFDRCVAEGLLSPNLEWKAGVHGGTGVAGLDDVVGREGYVEFVRRWTEGFEDFAIETAQIIDAGNGRVVAITRQTATGKESRVPVEMRSGMVFTFERGCIIRVTLFLKPNDALKAARLSE